MFKKGLTSSLRGAGGCTSSYIQIFLWETKLSSLAIPEVHGEVQGRRMAHASPVKATVFDWFRVGHSQVYIMRSRLNDTARKKKLLFPLGFSKLTGCKPSTNSEHLVTM